MLLLLLLLLLLLVVYPTVFIFMQLNRQPAGVGKRSIFFILYFGFFHSTVLSTKLLKKFSGLR